MDPYELKIEGKPLLVFPDSSMFIYYDGYFLIHHAGQPFGETSKEADLSHDAAFAAVAAAEWRQKCSKKKDVQCQCTCMSCVLAHAWDVRYRDIIEKLEKSIVKKYKS